MAQSSMRLGFLLMMEVVLFLALFMLLVIGLSTGEAAWYLLAVIALVVLVASEIARRNHRQEMRLVRPPVRVSIPRSPQIPQYDRSRERRAPQPAQVTFPEDRFGTAPQRPGAAAGVYCLSCGAPVRPGGRFCQRCGRPIAR